ncbi:MAG: inositol monophosphatase [Chloroflexi bacterium]|nr:inositol monophosphatase [Chloroflexota bacterium]
MSFPLAVDGRPALEVAQEVARQAGRVILRRFPGRKQISHKGRANLVTDTDMQAEKTILSLLRRHFPSHAILSEETGQAAEGSEYQWVVDPLDGTRNFAWGIPFFATCLALARGNEVVLGVVYDPVRRELFWAERGKGAAVNGKPMALSSRASLDQAVLGTDSGYDDDKAKRAFQLVTDLWPGVQAVRLMGSAALGLTYVACGRLDLYFHHTLQPWDLAASLLMIEEAGGKVTQKDGSPASYRSPGIIAANPALHAAFLERVRNHPWQQA